MSAGLWGEMEVRYFFFAFVTICGHILYNDPNQGSLRTRPCYTNSFSVQSALKLTVWLCNKCAERQRRSSWNLSNLMKMDRKMHPASSRSWPFLASDAWCTQSGLLVTSLAWWLTFFCAVRFKNKSPSFPGLHDSTSATNKTNTIT